MRVLWLGLIASLLPSSAVTQGTAVRPPAQGVLVDGHAPYPVPPATAEGVLEEMAGRAAVIFAGAVADIRQPADDVMEVEFSVSQGIRGAFPGDTYVVREWAGLWRDGPRYRIGQRRLMLLHAPGPAGLSSPVDGMDGAIPLVGGAINVSATITTNVGVAPAAYGVDLRWLEAKTLRTQVYAPRVDTAQVDAAQAQLAATAVTTPVAAPSPTLQHIVDLLAAWEAQRNAAR